jgi:hypothetical protein
MWIASLRIDRCKSAHTTGWTWRCLSYIRIALAQWLWCSCDITPKYPVEVFSACAAAAVYRTETYRQLGGFDETYFAIRKMSILVSAYGWLVEKACYYLMLKSIMWVPVLPVAQGDFSIYHGHRNLTWTFIKNVPNPLMFFLLPVHVIMIFYMGLFFAASVVSGFICELRSMLLNRSGSLGAKKGNSA